MTIASACWGEVAVGYSQDCMNSITPLAALYPDLSEEQLQEAAETLDRYLEVVFEIYERLRADQVAYAQFRTLITEISTLVCTPRGSGTLPENQVTV